MAGFSPLKTFARRSVWAGIPLLRIGFPNTRCFSGVFRAVGCAWFSWRILRRRLLPRLFYKAFGGAKPCPFEKEDW